MQTWLRAWELDPTGSTSRRWPGCRTGPAWCRDGLMPGMATPEEMAKLRDATGASSTCSSCS